MHERARAIRQMYRTDLTSFIQLAFQLLEPRTRYVPHWSIDLLGQMLQRCHHGDVRRLIINMPPRWANSQRSMRGDVMTETMVVSDCFSVGSSLARADCEKSTKRPRMLCPLR